MHNKHLARLFFILIFIFLASGAYLLLPDQPKIEPTKPIIQDTSWKNIVTNTVIGEIKKTDELSKKYASPIPATTTPITTINTPPTIIPTSTTAATPTTANTPITTTIEINGQKYNLNLPEKATAYDALKQLADAKQITMTTKEYSGMGYFIEEINSIKNNNQTGEYWGYYINGQSAKIGASSYILKNNDLITWKYAKAQI